MARILSTDIERNQDKILRLLYQKASESEGEPYFTGQEIQEASSLSPVQINDAIELLHNSGLVHWMRWMGTTPYKFGQVKVTSRGKYEAERRKALEESTLEVKPLYPEREPTNLSDLLTLIERFIASVRTTMPPAPTGSPYGFEAIDWEVVARRKSERNTLYVVLGCKFKSQHYKTEDLIIGVERMFEQTVQSYNEKNPEEAISLEFVPLHAGYGEHLFNEIARDIISSDIAVFEISDLAPNVFLEIGVALTWGSSVFLIKNEVCPPPPSDISGHTYADYRVSAHYFADPGHKEKLYRMVERVIRKKGY